jgi:hypothetical protein
MCRLPNTEQILVEYTVIVCFNYFIARPPRKTFSLLRPSTR